jgi:energy-coupling factor transport system ATP-binding protein
VRPALHELSLEIRSGESVVVLGADGAGKSTLAALLAGVVAPTTGEIALAPSLTDESLGVLPVGLVTQNPEDCFTSPVVREEMGVVLENLERDPAELERAVDDALAATGLAGHAAAHPATLSGGQKQLLAAASVLIADPPLLVLDEPLTLLDAAGRAEFDALLARRADPAAATVYLTGEVEEASRGGRTVVLHRGRIAWDGPSADLPQDAKTLGSWDLLPPLSPDDISADSGSTVAAEGWRGAGAPVGAQRLASTTGSRAGGASKLSRLAIRSQAEGDPLAATHQTIQERQPRRDRVEGGPQRQDPAACTGPSFPGSGPSDAGSIVVEDLHYSYDPGTPRERPVLRGVTLEARPGELLGIVGAIGSGKTTLIQHLNGLLAPQRGRVRVGDRVLEPGVKLARLLYREVGLVFQFPEKQLFAETVDDDVAAGPEFAGVPAAEIPGRVRAALESVGLDPAEHGRRPPFSLTWGEKRLVAIAGVLVLQTPHLALDEPGAGLDPRGRRRIMALLADLAHREGRTVVVVSHHLAELFRVADRIAVLHEGRVAHAGAPASLAGSAQLERWGLSAPARTAPRRTPPPRS